MNVGRLSSPSTAVSQAAIGWPGDTGADRDPAELARAAPPPTALKWSALHDAAGIVALLAGLAPELRPPATEGFPALIDGAGGWRKALAELGIDDLAAIMEPGIAALLAVHARGVSCSAAALALWLEFLRARGVLLALAPSGASGIGHRA